MPSSAIPPPAASPSTGSGDPEWCWAATDAAGLIGPDGARLSNADAGVLLADSATALVSAMMRPCRRMSEPPFAVTPAANNFNQLARLGNETGELPAAVEVVGEQLRAATAAVLLELRVWRQREPWSQGPGKRVR